MRKKERGIESKESERDRERREEWREERDSKTAKEMASIVLCGFLYTYFTILTSHLPLPKLSSYFNSILGKIRNQGLNVLI